MNKKTNDYTYLGQETINTSYREVTVQHQRSILQKTYLLLGIAFIPCALGVLATSVFNPLMMSLASRGIFGTLVLFAVMYGLMFAIEKNRYNKIGIGLLFVLTFFFGLILGPLLQIVLHSPNGGQVVMMASVLTTGVFIAMSLLARSSKINVTGLGGFLSVGGLVLLGTMLIGFFVHSSVLYLAISAGFVLFSSLMILWQTKMIIQGGETSYISAALSIFISLYNLFVSLLNILMALSGRD